MTQIDIQNFNPVTTVKESIRKQTWPVICVRIKCAKIKMVGSLSETEDLVRLVCPNCGLRVDVPIEWYRMSSSKMLFHLLCSVNGITEAEARVWINNVKYTHPTYLLSQRIERDIAKSRFVEVIGKFIDIDSKKIEEAHIVSIGANNCIELESLPFKWEEENILAIDLSEGALQSAKNKYPKIRCCQTFAEDLSADSVDINGKSLGYEIINNHFDICLALRIFQSSRFQLWSALTRIRDILKPGGLLMISVPRQTVLLTGNVHPGIYQSDGRFEENKPKETVEMLARELTSGSWMYSNVTLAYGTRSDIEYYLLAKKSY